MKIFAWLSSKTATPCLIDRSTGKEILEPVSGLKCVLQHGHLGLATLFACLQCHSSMEEAHEAETAVRNVSLLLLLQSPLEKALRMWFLYKTWIGQLLLRLPLTWWILTWQHHRIARYADSTDSKKSIKPFIKVSVCACAASCADKDDTCLYLCQPRLHEHWR
jgi:hypothetical protein